MSIKTKINHDWDAVRLVILTQPAWDVSENSQSDLHWERHLRDLFEKSQKKWLFCDVFNTSQIHLKEDVFYVASLRRLKHIFLNKDRLKLHATTISIKRDTPVKVCSCECWETFNTYFAVFMNEQVRITLFRSSRSQIYFKIGFLKNFAMFIEKTLESLF